MTIGKGAPTGAPAPISEGTLVRVIKEGSSHAGWIGKASDPHPNGRSVKVNLGSGRIRSYLLTDLEVM